MCLLYLCVQANAMITLSPKMFLQKMKPHNQEVFDYGRDIYKKKHP